MVEAHVSFRRPTKIFISHLHGDHVLGIPGLIQTMTLLQRDRSLCIYGPVGLVAFIQAFSSVLGGPGFPLKICEISTEGVVFEGSEYKIVAVEADHDGPSWSYVFEEHPRPGKFHPKKAEAFGVPEGPLWGRLQKGEDIELNDERVVFSREVVDPPRKGRKIVYSGDTKPTERLMLASKGADVLIHEATFEYSLIDKADENRHSTVTQAAEVAKEAEVETLVLTHISSRYPDANILLEEAVKVFPNTVVAEDLLEIELH